MKEELREASLELAQLALWLQMFSRAEEPPSPEQIHLIGARMESGLRRVATIKAFGGHGETPVN